ncbi:MAG TPA: M13 family metallopeptidase [Vicinamibacterales bacterium]|nr:M13 family metallopeptidase [Vicinamibacterales bacterium]
MMNRCFAALFFVALPIAAALTHAQTSSPAVPASMSGLDLRFMDRGVDPCVDFYEFACGGWTKNQPIPADRSAWGRGQELQERNNTTLRRILEDAGRNANADPETKKIGDYYATCMDESAVNAKGAAPLAPALMKIAALTGARDLPALVGELHSMGVNVFFAFGAEADFKEASMVRAIADQGGLGLPDRDYYFREDPKSVELRKQYLEHVGKMIALLGPDAGDPAAAANTVMRVETALAKAALDAVARRDPSAIYHKMTPAELQRLTPAFDWTAYFTAAGAPPIDGINVTEPEFFKALDAVVASTPLADLKTYLRWQLAHASAAVMSAPFVNENFRFYSATLTGAKELQPRWRRCVQYTDGDLGEALGKAFVKEAFGPAAKEDTLKMVRELETSLEKDIQGLSWMTDTTKRQAVLKLHAVANKIGYPDRWRDYGPLNIVRGDALGNSQRSNVFEFRRQMNRIGKPLDKSEWSMTPPTVNAYYNPLENNINFPAGILQPPFYSAKADAAVNYGAAGGVIGHELTHGFDDEGRQFDAQGNLKDWWTPEDAKAFEERAACIVDEYSSFTAVDDVKVNGKLTLGENAADNGGLRIALMAYVASLTPASRKTLDGFSPEQRFFVSYGQSWCENSRPERQRLLAQTNPHAPPKDRVNGVVSNMPEFQKAFACKADAPMVRKNACRVW